VTTPDEGILVAVSYRGHRHLRRGLSGFTGQPFSDLASDALAKGWQVALHHDTQ